MADQNPQDSRRPHFHRGRSRSHRPPRQATAAPPHGGERHATAQRDQVDVEQIMRDIRARISQRHGIELTTQQIQELAARRLEAILDPRTVKPRCSSSCAVPPATPATRAPRGRRARRSTTRRSTNRNADRFGSCAAAEPDPEAVLQPEPADSGAEHPGAAEPGGWRARGRARRRQAEWNALHYEILQRLVTEVSRASLEMQALSMRVEALAAKVDFNERRVRGASKAAASVAAARAHRRPNDASPAPTAPEPLAGRRRAPDTHRGRRPAPAAPASRAGRRRHAGRTLGRVAPIAAVETLAATRQSTVEDADTDEGRGRRRRPVTSRGDRSSTATHAPTGPRPTSVEAEPQARPQPSPTRPRRRSATPRPSLRPRRATSEPARPTPVAARTRRATPPRAPDRLTRTASR